MAKVKFAASALRTKLNKYKLEATKELADRLETSIVDSVKRGVSPVRGKKFKTYSKSYKDAIKAGRYSQYRKRVSPVNLTLSGKMLRSFFIKVGRRSLELGFDSELATIHNRRGAGKSKVIRRLLPRRGEFFNDVIAKQIRLAFKVASRKVRGK